MSFVSRVVTAALVVAPFVASAQPVQAPPASGLVSAAVLAAWQRAANAMPAAGEAMPAEKFAFKPSPAQMSFGEILAHEASANESLCAAMSGTAATPNESQAGATAPKDQLVARLRKSFEVCGAVIAKLTEAQLGDSVPFFGGRKATKARAAIALVQDWSDHYAQAAMYLRANGILPPTAQPRKP
jgi:hypothetical protein